MIRFVIIVSNCMQVMEVDAFRVRILVTLKILEQIVQQGYQKKLFAMDSITVRMAQDCGS